MKIHFPYCPEGFSSTETMGRLGHGLASYLVDEDIGAAYVTYEGGELKIDYKAITLLHRHQFIRSQVLFTCTTIIIYSAILL